MNGRLGQAPLGISSGDSPIQREFREVLLSVTALAGIVPPRGEMRIARLDSAAATEYSRIGVKRGLG